MSICGEPCDGCANRAEHHLCDACCHDEVDAIRKENRELREKLEWQAACTKALMESTERLAAELKEARAEVERLREAGAWMDEVVRKAACAVAYRRGAKAMREAAAQAVKHLSHEDGMGMGSQRIESVIRALPVPEDKP